MKQMEEPASKFDDDVNLCLTGKKLYGDDFSEEQIRQWFQDEELGYYNLGVNHERANHTYGYHALNRRHGFRILPKRPFRHVLGVGSAYGEELSPILGRSHKVTILEPADGFAASEVQGVPVSYVKPDPLGTLAFESGEFDLVTCLGVLHHIPNVSKVVSEIFRCLEPGGYALIREPIHSMGDWRKPRTGLTRRERGIPRKIFRQIIKDAGFEIVREKMCMFSLTSRLRFLLRSSVFDNDLIVYLDEIISSLPIWPATYHATHAVLKLRPTSVYFVLRRP